MSHRFTQHLCMIAFLSLLALATSASAQQQPGGNFGANVTSESFQDWTVRCPDDAVGPGACAMVQTVAEPESGQPVLQVVLNYPAEIDGPAMSFLVPLGVRLAPGMQLSVDGSEAIRFPYQVCQQPGCRADLPVSPTLLQQLRGGTTATLSLFGPQGNRLDLDISLMGFSAAHDRIAP